MSAEAGGLLSAARRQLRSLGRCAALVSLVAGGACSSGGADGEAQRQRDDIQPVDECPDLAVVPCIRQAAVVTIGLPGTATRLVYASDRPRGAPSWAGWWLDGVSSYLVDEQVLVRGDGSVRRVPPIRRGDTLLVADDRGHVVDEFDEAGRLLRQLDTLTGTAVATLRYDSAGRLAAVAPVSGRRVDLSYASDDARVPTKIAAAGTTESVVEAEAEGDITGVATPGGGLWRMTYDRGRMTGLVDPVGGRVRFQYDDSGRLLQRTDAAGSTIGFDRRDASTLAIVGPEGRVVLSSERRDGRWHRNLRIGDHTRVSEVIESQTSRRVELGDGRSVEVSLGPDPRFDWQFPIPTEQHVTMPSGVTRTLTLQRTVDGDDPVGIERLEDRWDGGVDAAVWSYEAADRTVTRTSPAGRRTSWRIDGAGRIDRIERPGLPSITITYDTVGRRVATAVGEETVERRWTAGELEEVAPEGIVRHVRFDEAGRVVETTTGSGAPARMTYDAAGHLTAVEPPGRPEHLLLVDPIGRPAGWVPPRVDGAPLDDVTFVYVRGLLAGSDLGPSPAYRIQRDERSAPVQMTSDGLAADLTWTDAALLAGATVQGGPSLRLAHDGPVLTEAAWDGVVAGSVGATYDERGRIASYQVNGAELTVARDPDGLYTALGPFELRRDADSGAIDAYGTEDVTVAMRRDDHGRIVEQTVSHEGRAIATVAYQRDRLGRVVAEHTTGVVSHDAVYGYDDQGRLSTAVTGGQRSALVLDENGNIVERSTDSATRRDIVDERDRLRRSGEVGLDYDSAGRIIRQATTGSAAATTYAYNLFGQLRQVDLADGRRVEYVVDGAGRRVAKRLDGEIVARWLYHDDLRPIAQVDGSGTVEQLYFYDDDGRLVGLMSEGMPYVIVTDQRGSPLFVVNGATGAVAQARTYDAFGRVLTDSAPGFQPFGFDGGLDDRDTGLVHLGAREYSPELGRFTSPDPLRFRGSDTNLYRFGLGDPVNRTDLAGLDSLTTSGACFGGSSYAPLGVGAKICFQSFSDGSWGVYGYGAFGAGIEAGFGPELNWGIFEGGDGARPGSALFEGVGPSAGGALGPSYEYAWPYGPDGFRQHSVGLGDVGFHYGPGVFTCLWCSHEHPDTPDGEGEVDGLPELDGPAQGHGDPHVITADGTQFDFHAAGEFVAMASSTSSFQVQVRQEPVPGLALTLVTAVAMDVAGDRVALYEDRVARRVVVRVDGEHVEGDVDLPRGGRIRRSARFTLVSWPDGSAVLVRAQTRGLHVSIDPAAALATSVRGAWGDADGDPQNDIRTADGEDVPFDPHIPQPVFDALYGKFAPSWLVTDASSLFDYEPGQSTASFLVPAFPSRAVTLDDFSETERAGAARVCGAAAGDDLATYEGCMIDLLATGDPGFAISARLAVAGAGGTAHRARRPGQRFQIALGEPVQIDEPAAGAGRLAEDDRDVFTFRAASGRMYLRPLTPRTCGEGGYVYAEVFDGPASINSLVVCGYGAGFTVPRDGVYRIEVTSSGPKTYDFRLIDVREFRIDVGDTVRRDDPGPGAGDSEVPDAFTFRTDLDAVIIRPAASDEVRACFSGHDIRADVLDGDRHLTSVQLCGHDRVVPLPGDGVFTIVVSGGPGQYEFDLLPG